MKKTSIPALLFAISCCMTSPCTAMDIGLVSASDTVSLPLICLDTLGRAATPDSVHVITWYHGQGANSYAYGARSGSPKTTSYIDTVSFAGVEYYYFRETIDDIDSSFGDGLYSGQVVLWNEDQPTVNAFTFIKVFDEAKDIFARIDTDISSRSDFDVLTDKVDLADNAVDEASVADSALTAAKITSDAWQKMKNYIWANIDTTSFPTDSSDFVIYLVRMISDGVWDEDTTGHLAAGKYGYETIRGMRSLPDSVTARIDSLLESLGYYDISIQQKLGSFGAGESSPTTLTLMQWLANSVGIDGTNDLHSKIDGLSLSGGGTEPETLIVKNVEDSTLIQGARVVVRTLDQSTTKVDGLSTDVNGKLILDMDSDFYFVAITANNYRQSLDTLTVEAGGGTDVLWLTSFDPGNPAQPDLCRVFGWVYDLSGQPLSEVTVLAEIPSQYQPVRYSNVVITPFRKTTSTDVAGYWYLDLFPNSLLSNPDSKYMITIEYPSGVILRSTVEVPDQDNWQLP